MCVPCESANPELYCTSSLDGTLCMLLLADHDQNHQSGWLVWDEDGNVINTDAEFNFGGAR